MSQEHSATAGSLSVVLQTVRMEIDDDDEDIVEVMLNLTNESAIPIGGISANIKTSLGATVEPTEGVSSIGPGLTRSFSFAFKLSDGDWTFSLSGQGQSLSLGPYEADFEFQQVKSRQIGNAVGSSLFSGAFDANLGDFGNVQERELIDASQVQMSSFFGENSEGGSTKISAGTFGNAEEDGPKTPPWEQKKTEAPVAADPLLSTPSSDPLLSTPVVSEPAAQPAVDLLTQVPLTPVQPEPVTSPPPSPPVEQPAPDQEEPVVQTKATPSTVTVWTSIRSSKWSTFRATKRTSIRPSHRSSIGAALWSTEWSSIGAALWSTERPTQWPSIGSPQWSSIGSPQWSSFRPAKRAFGPTKKARNLRLLHE